MNLELNRAITPTFSGDADENIAFIHCQEAALKVAEVLLTKGEVCAYIDPIGLLMWLAPFEGRLQLSTSCDLRSNTTNIESVQVDFVEDFCTDRAGFEECTDAFNAWLENPVYEVAGAYKAGVAAVEYLEAWNKAFAELKTEGWAETGANVITRPSHGSISYGWSALINQRIKKNQENKV